MLLLAVLNERRSVEKLCVAGRDETLEVGKTTAESTKGDVQAYSIC